LFPVLDKLPEIPGLEEEVLPVTSRIPELLVVPEYSALIAPVYPEIVFVLDAVVEIPVGQFIVPGVGE